MIPSKVYDILKWVALVVLPALGTLYFALAQIWGFPYGAEIVGTITAIDAFLGALLGISTSIYNKSEKDAALKYFDAHKEELENLSQMQKEFEKEETPDE